MPRHAVVWTRTAHDDLAELINYIAWNDPLAAKEVLARIEKRARTLAQQAGRGRIVPELREVGVLHYRELVERPWRIVFRIETRHVFVLAVLDARRDLQTLLLERLVRS